MNIEDWLDNANIRLENRRVSYSILTTEIIRAVIELHKPRQGYGTIICDSCSMEYPCQTVRAIENTLKEYT